MKKRNILIMSLAMGFSVISIAQTDNRDIGVAKSTFWQAPYSKIAQIKIEKRNASVSKDCADFKKIIVEKEGATKLSPESIDTIRQLSSEDSMEELFSVTFTLKDTFIREFTENLPQESTLSIPFYNQTSSFARLDPSLVGFELIYEKDSLSALMSSLGLLRLPIKLTTLDGKPSLKVFGKDAVCDLIDRKAFLRAKGQASVTLPKKTQIALNNFYSAVQDQIKSVLSLNEGTYAKATRLGYRLSALISPSTTHSDEVEKSTLALFKLLFKENSIEYSNVWERFDNQPVLSVFGNAVKVPVTIELGAW